jgi:predicted NUDIX family NTP pyrophosphohydrolase
MSGGQPQVLLAHMGSPWWAKKDIGAWTIPKGLAEAAQKTVRGQAELFERLANFLHVPFGAEEIPKPPGQGSLF